MSLDRVLLHRHFARLIETWPDVHNSELLPSAGELEWLARAEVLVVETRRSDYATEVNTAISNVIGGFPDLRSRGRAKIRLIVFKIFTAMELQMPSAVQGAFVPVGSHFDALTALSKVFGGAKRDVFIVDPYLDETVLTEFGNAVPEGCTFRLLADEKDSKPTLLTAARRWVGQYGAKRPLQVRLAPPRVLHDRALFIDGTIAWTLSQSIKDFAKRSPAEIIRADDVAAMKIAAYEAIWSTAKDTP